MKANIFSLTLLLVFSFRFSSAVAGQTPVGGGGDLFEELVASIFAKVNARDFNAALPLCEAAKAKRPGDERAFVYAGYAYMGLLKFDAASAEFAAAIKLKPAATIVYFYKAEADLFRKKPDEGVATMRALLAMDPTMVEAYDEIGSLLVAVKERRDEAVEAYRQVAERELKDTRMILKAGERLQYLNDLEGAEKAYRKVVAADASQIMARSMLARVLIQEKRLKEAREIWSARVGEDRMMPSVEYLLKTAETLEAATAALAEKPDDPARLIAMGYAVMEGPSWVSDGRQERALEYFKKARDLDRSNADAQLGICVALAQMSSTSERYKPDLERETETLRKLDPARISSIEAAIKKYESGQLRAPSTLRKP